MQEEKRGYQRGSGGGAGRMNREGQLYCDGWKLNFWWREHCSAFRCRNTMLYIRNLCNVITQALQIKI